MEIPLTIKEFELLQKEKNKSDERIAQLERAIEAINNVQSSIEKTQESLDKVIEAMEEWKKYSKIIKK